MTEIVKYLSENFDCDELVQKLRFIADRSVLSLNDKDIAKKFNMLKKEYITSLYEAYEFKIELENEEVGLKGIENHYDKLNGGE